MKKYMTGAYSRLIEEVEVVKETAKQIVVATKSYDGKIYEHRTAKGTWYRKYHDTWDEAYEYLVTKTEESIAKAKDNVARLEKTLEEIKGLKSEVKKNESNN